ncbi:MAG: hypothetical protein C0415_01460 [Thermodesulfovibrio sp.]|nr:hypothetical protein [Thermodesulfovibrio sp.]
MEEPSVTKEPVKEKASQEQPSKQDKKQSVSKDAKGVKAGDAKPPKKKKPKPREDAVKETAKKEKDFSPAYDSEKLQQIKPRDTQKLDAHLHIAKAYESKREYHQALQSYKRALEIDPDNYIIMNNISSVLINMGAADDKTRLSRFQEAIQYSKNALNIKKDYVPSLINLGIASLQLGNFTEGESYLTKVLSIEPSNNLAALNLAILYEKRGEHDKAYDYFSKLSSTGDIRGYLGAARILEKQGKVSEAARFYREIISKTTVDSNTKRFATERLQQLGQ